MMVAGPEEPEAASRNGVRVAMGSWSKTGSFFSSLPVTLTVSRLAEESVERDCSAPTLTCWLTASGSRVIFMVVMPLVRRSVWVWEAKPE